MVSCFVILVVLVMVMVGRGALASDADKPHTHRGVLTPYSGQPIPYSITSQQSAKLSKQEPVVVHDVVGKGGRAMVIQDIVSRPLTRPPPVLPGTPAPYCPFLAHTHPHTLHRHSFPRPRRRHWCRHESPT